MDQLHAKLGNISLNVIFTSVGRRSALLRGDRLGLLAALVVAVGLLAILGSSDSLLLDGSLAGLERSQLECIYE